MKIATFTDHFHTPSSRFRIRQYTPLLEKNGIYIHDYYREFSTETAAPKNTNTRIRDSYYLIMKALLHEFANISTRLRDSIKSNQHDVIWLSRQLIIGYPSFEVLIRKPLVYDIDDAIYLNGRLARSQFETSTKRATVVTAGNEFLAEEASKHCKDISIIPTAVNTERWKPLVGKNLRILGNDDEFIIGWSGTSTSFKYFLPLEREIKKFILEFPSARLVFMADRFPHELRILNPYIIFTKWHSDNEVQFIQSLDVGLMPTAHDMWSRGKCAYKSLLYSACGIPIIATPTGVNMQILNQSDIGFGPKKNTDWYKALCLLFSDRKVGYQLGENGVKLVEKKYSVHICAPKLIDLFKKIT